MARLTAAQRNALPDSAFAGPGRSYPVNDAAHARAALSRGSQYASPSVKAKVKHKVHRRYPAIGKPKDKRDQMLAAFMKRNGS
jgi:hypothetical protein